MAILGTKKEVISAVAIPVNRCRASRMALKEYVADDAHILEPGISVLGLKVSEPACILTVHNKVGSSVIVPIDQA